MRYALLLLTLLALSGCSFAVSDVVPKAHALPARTFQVTFDSLHASTPTPAPGFIDLSTVAQSVTAVPRQLEELQRAIVWSSAILAAIGLANAALMVSLLRARRRVPIPIPTSIIPVTPAFDPVTLTRDDVLAPADVSPASKMCSCGSSISARSKSGRCRQCAREDLRRRRERAGVGLHSQTVE
jgi:hypothetical protein